MHIVMCDSALINTWYWLRQCWFCNVPYHSTSCYVVFCYVMLCYVLCYVMLCYVMLWCHEATGHCLSQYLPISMLPYDVTRPQWVNKPLPEPMSSKVIAVLHFWEAFSIHHILTLLNYAVGAVIKTWILDHIEHSPDSKVPGAKIGPIWGRQDPGGPHVGPMNLAIWPLP